MKMLSVDQVAEKWNLSPRTIQNLCKNGRIQGAVNFGKSWMIPENAKRPADGRRKKEVKKYSGNLAVAHINEHVHQIFKISGFNELFPIYDNVVEGLNHLQKK